MSARPRCRAVLALLVLAVAALAGPAEAQDGTGVVTAQVRVGVASNPLRVELTLSSSQVKVGERFRASALVHNDGDEPFLDGQVTLHVSEANIHVDGTTTVWLSPIRPSRRSKLSWQLCSVHPGTYLVQASARTNLGTAEFESFSPAVALTVGPVPGRRPATCSGW